MRISILSLLCCFVSSFVYADNLTICNGTNSSQTYALYAVFTGEGNSWLSCGINGSNNNTVTVPANGKVTVSAYYSSQYCQGNGWGAGTGQTIITYANNHGIQGFPYYGTGFNDTCYSAQDGSLHCMTPFDGTMLPSKCL